MFQKPPKVLNKLIKVQKKYEENAEDIYKSHPHIPRKLVYQMGFGDGKTRVRHHTRCDETIRIGEISINEDLIILDENVPIQQRYKIFGQKDFHFEQRFVQDMTKE